MMGRQPGFFVAPRRGSVRLELRKHVPHMQGLDKAGTFRFDGHPVERADRANPQPEDSLALTARPRFGAVRLARKGVLTRDKLCATAGTELRGMLFAAGHAGFGLLEFAVDQPHTADLGIRGGS